jgi:hypothetical protein
MARGSWLGIRNGLPWEATTPYELLGFVWGRGSKYGDRFGNAVASGALRCGEFGAKPLGADDGEQLELFVPFRVPLFADWPRGRTDRRRSPFR